VFGVHLHQPVGNFDHVFADHLRDVYRPLVERLAERRFFPFTLHISGPLLEWLEAHDAGYLDLIGRLATDGHVEPLLAGFDERLRYLIPFRPPAEIAAYLRELRSAGRPLAVFVDDGEKFGGWPGTKDWVYTRGWLAQFLDAVEAQVAAGEVRLTTPGAALDTVRSGGLAYLPTASYREMEAWSLPPAAARRLAVLEHDVGEARLAGPDGALVVGGLDFDGDGAEGLWIHSGVFSAVVSPERGGVIEEYTVFEPGINSADVLTRRRESYHEPAPGHAAGDASPAVNGTP